MRAGFGSLRGFVNGPARPRGGTRRAMLALALALSLTGFVPAAHAQMGGAGTPLPGQLIRASAAPVSLPAGGSATVVVSLEVLPSWHVNANPPALDYNIPTTVTLSGGQGLTPGRVSYPAGKEQKFGFEETPLLVYDGTVQVRVPLTASLDAMSGTLSGSVEFQACNDEVCLPPASVVFAVAVTVTEAVAGAPVAVPDTAAPTGAASGAGSASFSTAPPAGGASSTVAKSELEKALSQGGLGWFLALFVGGLLLNLTPCVFPMLGVTVSIFGARRNEPLPKVITTAALYVLGICATYTATGAAAGMTGELLGSMLQVTWVNVLLGLLMVTFSLGMFGVYEMQPPTWVMDRLGGAQATSFVGAFLAGLGVGIIAAPCVGPIVSALLVLIGTKGSVAFGVQTMFTLSLGLGFPYLFLATFSNLLQKLPRSGDWMVWVKHVFGLIMAALGLYYFAIGLAPDLAPWVLPVALLAGGAWLGFLDHSSGTKGRFKAFTQAAGLLAVIAGVVMGSSLYQASTRTLKFQPFDAAAVQASLAAGRPVMMDFSADWCVPCHELELVTFTDPRVVAEAKKFDRYKVDLTKYDSAEANETRKRYGITGVPTIVFLGPDGQEIVPARVEGFLPPEPFMERMSVGGAR